MEEQAETGGPVPSAEQEMEDESITRLKALKGPNRGVLTSLENDTLDLIARSENGEDINFERLTTIDRLLDEKLYNANIFEKINVDEIELEVEEASEIELRTGETHTKINNFLKKDRQPTRTPYGEHASDYTIHGITIPLKPVERKITCFSKTKAAKDKFETFQWRHY